MAIDLFKVPRQVARFGGFKEISSHGLSGLSAESVPPAKFRRTHILSFRPSQPVREGTQEQKLRAVQRLLQITHSLYRGARIPYAQGRDSKIFNNWLSWTSTNQNGWLHAIVMEEDSADRFRMADWLGWVLGGFRALASSRS